MGGNDPHIHIESKVLTLPGQPAHRTRHMEFECTAAGRDAR